MNADHVKVWTDTLRSTEFGQIQGGLGSREFTAGEGGEVLTVGMCCLGIACVIPDAQVPIDWAEDGVLSWRGGDTMPPVELHEWLGVAYPDMDENDGHEVWIDWPIPADHEPVGFTPFPQVHGSTDRWRDREGHALRINGCANLNDMVDLTFSQIADVIDYFGLATHQVPR